MEITINYYGQAVSVSVDHVLVKFAAIPMPPLFMGKVLRLVVGLGEILVDIATEGRLPYCATPEELVCQQETLDEILAVLALCTPTQRERFLLYALDDFSYAEIAEMCGCTKGSVQTSINAARNIFRKFLK
ncbi:sigma-70 family RNA polymerase sigma factor [Pseudoflavonifractor sp. 60]|nr:sigma-70 family RNA polymerase sigma factor [Pseudoflavonifractor sp. 60]